MKILLVGISFIVMLSSTNVLFADAVKCFTKCEKQCDKNNGTRCHDKCNRECVL